MDNLMGNISFGYNNSYLESSSSNNEGNYQTYEPNQSNESNEPNDYRILLADCQFRNYIKIPQIIFVGMQTSGKSSLIEALVGLRFNFTGTGIATRVPLQITTTSISPAPSTPTWSLKWDGTSTIQARHFENISTEEVHTQLDALHADLITDQSVCSTPVSLHLHWQFAPDLTFIDLPGFKGNAKDEEEQEMQSKIYEMNKSIILSKLDEIFVVVEPASSDASNYYAHQLFKNIVQDCELPVLEKRELAKSVILACSKFDLVQDVQALYQYLSDYASYVAHSFVFSIPHSKNQSSKQFSDLLNDSIAADNSKAATLSKKWIRTEFGIGNFTHFLEKLLKKRLIDAIPKIKTDLGNMVSANKTKCNHYKSLQSESTQKWVYNHLNSTVVDVAALMIQVWDAKCLDNLKLRTRSEEEQQTEDSHDRYFTYKKSLLWQNPDYQSKLRKLLLYDCPLAGSSQIRRLLREFEVSLFTRVLTLDTNFKSLLENKILSMRSGDHSCTPWNNVIVELVKDMSTTFLTSDIQFLNDSIQTVLKDWANDILASKSDIPRQISEHILQALSDSLSKLLSHSKTQMHGFVISAITTATRRTVPKPGSTLSELYELCSSFYSYDSSSELNQQLGNIEITVSDIQVGKAKRLCMQRLNLGVTVISQALGAIFDSFFTANFRSSIMKDLVFWERKYTTNYSEDIYDKEIIDLESENQKILSWMEKLDKWN